MSCEEDDEEVNRRMEDVARHLRSSRQDMFERGLRFLSFAGKDAVLAQPDRHGNGTHAIVRTRAPRRHQIAAEADCGRYRCRYLWRQRNIVRTDPPIHHQRCAGSPSMPTPPC